jgi:hypothetical protein
MFVVLFTVLATSIGASVYFTRRRDQEDRRKFYKEHPEWAPWEIKDASPYP